jgi:hypothetical protein
MKGAAMYGTTRRLMIGFAAIVGALALASGALAAQPPRGMTQSEYDALMVQSAAMNGRYGNAVTRLTASEFASLWRNGGWRLEPQELVALVERSEGLNSGYGGADLAGRTPAEVQAQHARDVGMNQLAASGVFTTQAPSVSDGFDWGDFGIGAGGMFGLVLLAVGLLARFGRLHPAARTS